jgi:hypothetical protein
VCRLSIIVPYDRDEAAFEATLVSVLENRPEYCEIIVAHDGSYSDPFDLGDEVRFVVARATKAEELLRIAAADALGRVVHFLGGGARATEGWTDEPLSLFEQSDLACVTPVIRDMTPEAKIVAAGWRDTATRLRSPLAAGGKQPSRTDLAAVQGAYLFAGFWRRSALETVLDLPTFDALSVTDYLWTTALKLADWRTRVAPNSAVLASPKLLEPSEGVVLAATVMQQIRSGLKHERLGRVLLSSLVNLAFHPQRSAAWKECIGRYRGVSQTAHAKELVAQLREVGESSGPDLAQSRILAMPKRDYTPARRAA